MPRYTESELNDLVKTFHKDGFCVLRHHFATEKINEWRAAFMPLLEQHIEREGGHKQNRGAARYYVTLPFVAPFADPAFYEDDDILHICQQIVGKDMVMCQLATDTPLRGSDYQETHSDAAPLFPETVFETPTFQLAVNFPLVDVTPENGPFEVARGTHLLAREEGARALANGECKLEPIILKAGDVMIRDVRGLHRGTPNKTDEPRPMTVIGYSRKWLLRPEVNIRIPRVEWEKLSERAQRMLRFNPIVESLDTTHSEEVYQTFAY